MHDFLHAPIFMPLRTLVLTLALLVGSSTHGLSSALAQSGCNDTNHDQICKEGIQADTVLTHDCAQSTASITVKLTGEGTIVAAEVGAEGSVTLTLQTPASCVRHQIEYSGAIHQCSSPLEGWHCNPKGGQVRVTKWTSPNPCPDFNIDLIGWLNRIPNIMDWFGNGAPIILTCRELVDATSELDENSRTRNTARLTECSSGQSAHPGGDGGGVPSPIESVVGGSYYLELLGDPLQIDVEALVPAGCRVPGTVVVEGLAELEALVASDPSLSESELVRQLHASSLPLAGVDDLAVLIEGGHLLIAPDGAESWIPFSTNLSGSFRSGGDCRFTVPTTATDEDGAPHVFLDDWARVGTALYHHESGSLSGLVYPGSNGASSVPLRTGLWFSPLVQSWIDDPFLLEGGGAYVHEVLDIGGGEVEVVQGLALAQPAPTQGWLHDWLGTDRRYVIREDGPTPRVVRMEVRTANGAVVERREFDRFVEVAPGNWRPGVVHMECYDALGRLARQARFEFRARAIPDVLGPIRLPIPPSRTWDVWIQ